MQAKAVPQVPPFRQQTAFSSVTQQPQDASALAASPAASASAVPPPAQAYTPPSAESPESTQAPEQLAADLMQPSLNPTEASGPLPEEGTPTRAGPSPGDTIFDLAEFQVTSHDPSVTDASQVQTCMPCMSCNKWDLAAAFDIVLMRDGCCPVIECGPKAPKHCTCPACRRAVIPSSGMCLMLVRFYMLRETECGQ